MKCGDNYFMCANGTQCIRDVYKCDGAVQCEDGSDEENCGKLLSF